MAELLLLNDCEAEFRTDGKTHRVGFIARHPAHGEVGYTNFVRTPGTPFCCVYSNRQLKGKYRIAYPSELVLDDGLPRVTRPPVVLHSFSKYATLTFPDEFPLDLD